MKKTISLELNEVNFDFVMSYIEKGHLPTLAKLIEQHGISETIAEKQFEELEPWIQWVTHHTGLSYAEHGVFRLGDSVGKDHVQIWERLEQEYGLSVAAVSPMNAANKTHNAPFFIPDPWTVTRCDGTWDVQFLYDAVKQLVNDNAQSKMTLSSVVKLLIGAIPNLRFSSIPALAKHALRSRKYKWEKALVLDLLLTDLFISKWKKYQPDFSSLFLNAGAHIQHHHMYSSVCYDGDLKNPVWYDDGSIDPLLEVYKVYDHIVATMLQVFNCNVVISTGLSQKPNRKMVFYYRPKIHAQFLSEIGVEFSNVEPRMSRDFLVEFDNADQATKAEALLTSIKAEDGKDVIYVDNRGDSLFCMFCYTDEIKPGFAVMIGDSKLENFDRLITHVSIENAIHRTIGYVLDTDGRLPEKLDLKDLYAHFEAKYQPSATA